MPADKHVHGDANNKGPLPLNTEDGQSFSPLAPKGAQTMQPSKQYYILLSRVQGLENATYCKSGRSL